MIVSSFPTDVHACKLVLVLEYDLVEVRGD